MRAETHCGIKRNRDRSRNTCRRVRRAAHSTFQRRARPVRVWINGAPDKRDANLLSELEQYYDNTTRNFAEQVQIDSKYYETDEIKPVLYKNKQFKYHTLHLNIQGLMSSLDHLKHLIHKLETNHIHIDFILVCETFLHGIDKDKTFSKLCEISGYTFVYKN